MGVWPQRKKRKVNCFPVWQSPSKSKMSLLLLDNKETTAWTNCIMFLYQIISKALTLLKPQSAHWPTCLQAGGRPVDASQEMVSVGVANILGSFVGAMPTTHSLSRWQLIIPSTIVTDLVRCPSIRQLWTWLVNASFAHPYMIAGQPSTLPAACGPLWEADILGRWFYSAWLSSCPTVPSYPRWAMS